ncbi:MAG TPA: T9SS type A sorting domain-containing protein [Bacteroidales bacterium]|nr:T9SS type A sorting domain-containing protein [Bacteroidales bacterium]
MVFRNGVIKAIVFYLILVLCGPLFAQGAVVYPNPWVPESGKERYGSLSDGITFKNLPSDGEISIYSTNGLLVKRFIYTGSTAKWYGKNTDNEDVASGVYLWVVKSSDSTIKGKLIILR